MGNKVDLNGKVFGRLTVTQETDERDTCRSIKWACRCECGNLVTVSGSSLTSGATRSCGCFGKERRIESQTTHGLSGHPLYTVWCAMKTRCYSPSHSAYSRYGGRGIEMCSHWLESFEVFYNDVVGDYKEGLELDRIDNDGNYTPNNTRWVTHQQNSMNTSRSRNGSSKYKGVCWFKPCNKWMVRIMKDGKAKFLGYFTSETEAALAYNEAAKELFGDYANLNKL